jgi:hypothetical protein
LISAVSVALTGAGAPTRAAWRTTAPLMTSISLTLRFMVDQGGRFGLRHPRAEVASVRDRVGHGDRDAGGAGDDPRLGRGGAADRAHLPTRRAAAQARLAERLEHTIAEF